MAILDQFKLDGKVAIVTGAGRGLGQGISFGLAEAGADIVAVDVIDQAETKAGVEKRGRRCATVHADLSKSECVPQIVDARRCRLRPHRHSFQQRRHHSPRRR